MQLAFVLFNCLILWVLSFMPYQNPAKPAFSLTEVLIALALMGVLAAMTIPKVLVSQQKSTYNPKVKEAVFMVQSAYTDYQMENTPGSTTTFGNLTPYINYVKVNSTATIDDAGSVSGCGGTVPSVSCATAGKTCIVLPNGTILYYTTATQFNNTASTNALSFIVDPDGKYSNDGSAWIFLYFNSNTKSVGHISANTSNSSPSSPFNPNTVADPDWFEWK